MQDLARRDYLMKRFGQLEYDRESFDSHYKDLAQFTSPRRGRFEVTEHNKGTKKHKLIINSRGTKALDTARAGMFAGVMSPTRPWFALSTPDPDLNKFHPVKLWLRTVADQMREVFNAGNLYNMAPTMIGEMLLFGTGCMTHVDDDVNLARFYTHTVGSYWLAQSDKFEVDTMGRQMMMTASQIATKFTDTKDLSRLSQGVRRALDQNEFNTWFEVRQLIEPNHEFVPGKFNLGANKPWSSTYFEIQHESKDAVLKTAGFNVFPAYCPRWGVTGEDTYGSDCPGMVSLGDIKQLQIQEKRKAQGIDKMVNPPLIGPASVRNVPVSSLPGGLTIYDGDSSRNKLEPLYQVNFSLGDLKEDMDRVERRIEDAYFVELFLAISNMEGVQPRNELELSERNGERLLQLGPVLERVQSEFLDPLISRTFTQMAAEDLLPPPPEELEGQTLKVNYISSLAQAQRAVDTRGIDRLTQYVGGLRSMEMTDAKKFNTDKAIEMYADLTGVSPEVINDDDQVAQERQAEQEQMQRAQQVEQAQQLAQAGAAAGQIDMEGDNAASRAIKGATQ